MRVVVLIAADAEWRAVVGKLGSVVGQTPWGETRVIDVAGEAVLFAHGGWGKIAAAASAQHLIDRYEPELLINLGTCGGFAGAVQQFEPIIVERTVVYDLVERMGDPEAAIAAYATVIDVDWVGDGRRGTLVSADQDVDPAAMARLASRYGAIAADWESGAIAHVAQRNDTRVLIVRGVSDVVGEGGSEVYGRETAFADATVRVMGDLLAALPGWIERSRGG